MENVRINLPMEYSLEIVLIIFEIMIILMFIAIFYAFYLEPMLSYFKKPNVTHAKYIYLKKLNSLYKESKDKSANTRELYFKLSKIIREFIKKSTGINVVSFSKSEIKKLNIKDLDKLMEEYYPPEFSVDEIGNIQKSIERTISLIKLWE